MVIKTKFSIKELSKIIQNYSLGDYRSSKSFTTGTVQTNYLIVTSKGNFVLRYYENRQKESVLFESNLIKYLKNKGYPCPAPYKNKKGRLVGTHKSKPYILLEFVEGIHLTHPSKKQINQLIRKVAELHILTKDYRPVNKKYRWNYNIKLCRELAQIEEKKINSANSKAKLNWLENQLQHLELPESLAKGICHCDFHFSNVLYKDHSFKALIDFDDANYTYLMFDVVGLVEYEAWPQGEKLDLQIAKNTLREYEKYRLLNNNEKRHFFDVYKLSILFDCIWFFARGDASNFNEKRKINYLDSWGREKFFQELFGTKSDTNIKSPQS